MPHRIYRHRCSDGLIKVGGMQTCRTCGAEGTFLRWDRSMVESMAQFTRVTGLPAMGPGRLMGRKIPTRPCWDCYGVGWVGTEEQCTRCEACGGQGMWLVGGEAAREALRWESQDAIKRYKARLEADGKLARIQQEAERRKLDDYLAEQELRAHLLILRLSRSKGVERAPLAKNDRAADPGRNLDTTEEER